MDDPTPRTETATDPDPAAPPHPASGPSGVGATATGQHDPGGATGSGALGRVPIEIVISVGRSRPTIRELLHLQRDAVLPLDRRVSDPVDLLVGERLIARGVLEELDGARAGLLGVRLTEVIDMRDGL